MGKRIKFDSKNFNKHTERGMKLLEKSIEEVGIIESISVDANDEIITGNARKEVFDKLGYKPKFIELDNNEYPVIKTKLNGEQRVKAAILANTVGKHNLSFDNELIQEVAVDEFNIDIEELGIEIIKDIDVDKFFEESDREKEEKIKSCPHCGGLL